MKKRAASQLGLVLAGTLILSALGYGVKATGDLPAEGLRHRTLGWAIPAQAQSLRSKQSQPNWAALEQAIIAEHNQVRQNPQSYIPILEAYLERMDAQGNIPNGCGPNCTLLTQEGKPAVEEAINFLRIQPAVGALTLSEGAAQAAKLHAQDQQNGATGHLGSNGSTLAQRLERVGLGNLGAGENIDYGSTTAQEVMISLIVDDGVPGRGHRTNIFEPNWTVAGAGCGPHATYGTVCVIDYAKGAQTTASNSQFKIINNGNVDLLSMRIAGTDILGGTLARGESRDISLTENQACTNNLSIQLGGNYSILNWNDLDLCGATMTITRNNQFRVNY